MAFMCLVMKFLQASFEDIKPNNILLTLINSTRKKTFLTLNDSIEKIKKQCKDFVNHYTSKLLKEKIFPTLDKREILKRNLFVSCTNLHKTYKPFDLDSVLK